MQLDYFVSKIGKNVNGDKKVLVENEWISEKSHRFPIAIELSLRKKSEIEKIEIVAHNNFIPKRIGIYNEKVDEDGFIGDVEFKAKKSEQNKFELKNIFLDEKCEKLILDVEEPHIDIMDNPDKQVGIIEVKLFGKYLPPQSVDQKYEDPEKIPKMDHKYSKEIEAMIVAVEKNKQTAVANEDFKFAKMAQLAVRQMKKSTKEMEELENDRNDAIEDEDYQRAHDLQDEITALRANILAAVDPILLDNTMPRNDEIHRPKNLFNEAEEGPAPSRPKLYKPVDISPTEVPADPSHSFLLPPTPASRSSRTSSSSRKRTPIPKRPSTRDSITSATGSERSIRPATMESRKSSASRKPSSSSRRRSSSHIGDYGTGTNKFLEKENMIVPAALHKKRSSSSTNYETPSENPETRPSSDDITEEQVVSSVAPDNRSNVRSSISIFGLETIGKLYSKHYEYRKEAIEEVVEKVDSLNSEKAASYFETINFLIAHLLKEPLYNVYKDVLLLWHRFCTARLPSWNLTKLIIRIAAESTETLALRVVSSEKRIVNETLVTFRDASKLPYIAKAYSSKLISSKSKNLKGRAILVEIITKVHTIPNDDINLNSDNLSDFASKCIRTSDQQVRTIGKDLMMKLYKNGAKQSVQHQLSKFADSDSNNPTYQRILREIYNFDGSRLKTEKKKKISFNL